MQFLNCTFIVPRGFFSFCWCSGNGGPQTCLPAACGVAQRGPSTAQLHQHKTQDPREGPSLVGRTTGSFLRHGLIRRAHEEAESSRRGTSRGAHDTSHDDQGRQSGASPRRSSFPLWCKGGKRSHGVPRHQAKVAISVQRDQDQQDGKMEVTMEPKAESPPEPFAGGDCFCQDKLY